MQDNPRYIGRFHGFAGEPECYRPFSNEDRKRLTGRLPDAMLDFLELDGWSSFRKKALWFCDPDDMKSVRQSWLKRFPQAEIFLRTALGDFYFWDGKYCWSCLVHTGRIMYACNNITWFFADFITDKALFKALRLPKFSNQGQKNCGSLAPDEMYFLTPAISLGGSWETSKLQKGKMSVALDIMSQMQAINVERIGTQQ
jgi:hypothetical protein